MAETQHPRPQPQQHAEPRDAVQPLAAPTSPTPQQATLDSFKLAYVPPFTFPPSTTP